MRIRGWWPVVALMVGGCGGETAHVPGTIPASVRFEIARESDALRGRVPVVHVETNVHDVGRPRPDFLVGGTAAWTARTLFGSLVDDPGARFEVAREGFTEGKQDPWRVEYGAQVCLVVDAQGRADFSHVGPDAPPRANPRLAPGQPTTVRLVLDHTARAAHRRLGVVRVEVLQGGRPIDTLTEDDFVERAVTAGWRLRDAQGQPRDAWSLRALGEDHLGRCVEATDADGSGVRLSPDAWADPTRVPVLHWRDGRLDLGWEDPAGGPLPGDGVTDVRRLAFVRGT